MNRRDFIALGGSVALSLTLPSCRSVHPPLRDIRFSPADYEVHPQLWLATSLRREYDETAAVEGAFPPEVSGTLYRNGPGLFERSGYRKRCLLDGDGMIHAWEISGSTVRFRNRFVRTAKYTEEEAAGKFLHPTWSTQAPGGPLANLLGRCANQAGISVTVRNGRLFAFDEFRPPYELDPRTLATLGVCWLGMPERATVFSAHSRIDPRTDDWIFFGLDYGLRVRLHLTTIAADGTLRSHRVHPLPAPVYIHDFFATERHIVIHLHPVRISPFPVLLGLRSVVGAMTWRPEEGSVVLVFERDGAASPRRFETGACWMWHTLNAYEEGETIVADFVGYRTPDHFLGEDPALFALMEGRRGRYESPGELRRFVIDLREGRIRQHVLAGENHEFPAVNLWHACHRHRFGYLARVSPGAPFFDEVVRVDVETGRSASYRFPSGVFCTEPVFVPLPGHRYEPRGEEPGWLLTEGFDSGREEGFLALFRADAIPDGPVARAVLPHHLPLGFHGFWSATPA